MIRKNTVKRPSRKSVMDHATDRDRCHTKTHEVARSQYQTRSQVLEHRANDWLTVWQRKNEL